MLTDQELDAIRDENDNRRLNKAGSLREALTIDCLLAEVRELRLLLLDAVQDDTPGNRLWRGGVKAGLFAALSTAMGTGHTLYPMPGGTQGHPGEAIHTQKRIADAIAAIIPSTILPSK